MIFFHQDNINWGDYTKRETLYNPNQNPRYLQGMGADEAFNMPVHELEQKFSQQGNQQIKKVFNPKHHSFVVNTIHQLCKRAQLPMLSVILFKTNKVGASTAPNSEIDITKGAIQKLTKSELQALLAHEIAHSIIHTKSLNTTNEEMTADIIGAKLTSEQDMIKVIKYFSHHVTNSTDTVH